jgi:HEAT repeat protein
VRLRALEALRGFEQDDNVRQTLLDALLEDSNPGVRVEAINALRGLAEKGTLDDPRLVNVLRDRMQRDPNNYIRMQSAAAIRQLGPRGVY